MIASRSYFFITTIGQKFYINFIQGAKLEISGNIEKRYIAKFTDLLHNKLIHESEINNNMWTKTNIQYFINWKVEVIDKETNDVVFEHYYNAENKRVYNIDPSEHFAVGTLEDIERYRMTYGR